MVHGNGSKHPHRHDHGHLSTASGDRRIALAVGVNLLLTAGQIVGGLLSGSLALIADAVHNLSDALALAIAFGARRIARRDADPSMSFGYGRVEVVAALINFTTLIVLGLYLVSEAFVRFFEPSPVDGWIVVIVAGGALAVDTVTAMLTFTLAKSSLNIRAAFLHNLADALASIAVIISGSLILLWGFEIIDPIVTLGIAAYILWMSFSEIRTAIRILMLGSPPEFDTTKVADLVKACEGVADVHRAHLWQMSEAENVFDAHVVIGAGHWGRADEIKANIKRALNDGFGISMTTLELECSRHRCGDDATVRDS